MEINQRLSKGIGDISDLESLDSKLKYHSLTGNPVDYFIVVSSQYPYVSSQFII